MTYYQWVSNDPNAQEQLSDKQNTGTNQLCEFLIF